MEMRRMVNKELLNYCVSKERLIAFRQRGLRQRSTCGRASLAPGKDPTSGAALAYLEPPSAIRKSQAWVWAIEQAYESLKCCSPERARLMVRLYGLDGKLPALERRGWRVHLMEEFNISEPSLYRWRTDIQQAVLAGAVQAGVLSPYPVKDMPGGSVVGI